MRFIGSNAKGNDFEEKIPAGSYSGLFLRLAGTNDTGDTADHAIIDLVFTVNGEQIINVGGAFLLEMANQYFGHCEADSATASTVELVWYIPFELPYMDENSLLVQAGDLVTLRIQEQASAADVASGTYSLYGVTKNAVQNYLPRFMRHNIDASAATTLKQRIPINNISRLWLNAATASDIGNVLVERDGDLVANANYAELLSITGLFRQVESAPTWLSVELGDTASALVNSDVQLQVTFSAAETLNVVSESFKYDGDVTNRSEQVVRKRAGSRLDRVRATRPNADSDIAVLRKLTNPDDTEGTRAPRTKRP